MWKPMPYLDYVGEVIRPPSEADSIILQVTLGCSHNKCTFCPTYLDKPFALKPLEIVEEDLRKAAYFHPEVKRLFVADGDALVMPMDRWKWLLEKIRSYLPSVNRIGVYANAKSIAKKSDDDLKYLKDNGVGIIYLGIESGDDETLKYVCKDSDADQILQSALRVKAQNIKLSVTVLLGIAPKGRSLEHARATGLLLSKISPDYVGALTVMLVEGTKMHEDHLAGKHELPGKLELMNELYVMLQNCDYRGLFMANHASNYLPLKVRMPSQKENALKLIEEAMSGRVGLKPEAYRAL